MTGRVEHLSDSVTLYLGDCIAEMEGLESNAHDSCVTDPPYELKFMGKGWDGTGIAFQVETWRRVFRVLKPGAHLLAFGGTRTYHRMACAIEDAGFEIRDCVMWLYGSGFPKSLDVSKAIDKARDDYEPSCRVALWLRPHVERVGFDKITAYFGFKDETMARARWTSRSQPQVPRWEQWLELKSLCGFGAEMDSEVWRLNGRKGEPGDAWQSAEVVGIKPGAMSGWKATDADGLTADFVDREVRAPNSNAARQWSGFGTALKPACEPIVLARKPLSESTIAANVLKWGTGALNIDGCRVGNEVTVTLRNGDSGGNGAYGRDERIFTRENPPGRWPANIIHDGSDEVVGAFPETTSGTYAAAHADGGKDAGILGSMNGRQRDRDFVGSTGSASRFFYTAKADQDDRLGSRHPTVKPLDLMQYLVRLVSPPRGLVLDPFAGTGTTGEAASREGMRAVLIEKEEEYQDDIRRRIKLALCGPDERAREAAKARMKDKPVDHGPLFGSQVP